MSSFRYILFISSILLSACKRDKDDVANPQKPDEQELITTIKVSFKKSPASTDSLVFVWQDPDGDGGILPVVDPIQITTEYTYLSVRVLNESNPMNVDDISEEIYDNGFEHQLFYTTGTNYMDLSYLDMDNNGVPIGLKMGLSSLTNVSSSTLRIILKHQPGIKPISGNGNPTLGSTDFDVIFPIKIQ